MAATNKKAVLAHLEPEQYDQLKRLSEKTRVPMAAYLREAVDDLLVKYRRELNK